MNGQARWITFGLLVILQPGPSNDEDNHHRRGVLILDGRAVDSRRYAIDWKQIRDGASSSGDARDVHSYYCYGKAVLAVADGRVVAARDGLPDNIPGHGESFHPAVPITLETVAGNTITLMTERFSAEASVNFINVLNHNQLLDPILNIAGNPSTLAPTFGQLSTEGTIPRTVEFGIRVNF